MEYKVNAVRFDPLAGLSRGAVRVAFISCISVIFLTLSLMLALNFVYFLQAGHSYFTLLPGIICLIGIICCSMLPWFVIYMKRERDFTESTLRENRERYRSIIAASNTGAWEYHADTHYQWCSPEYFEMLGYEERVFLKNGQLNIQEIWIDLLHPDDKISATEHFSNYLASNSHGMYEAHFRMKHRNGDWKWIWSRGQTLKNADGTLSNVTLGTHIDITEKQNLEIELLSLNEKLLKYAHLNAHAVRAPVARLLGLVSVSKVTNDLDYQWFFEKIENEANDIDKVLGVISAELNDIERRSVAR